MVVVVAAIIRILLVRLGKFVMTHVRLREKKLACVFFNSSLFFSFFMCFAMGFDIHKTRYDAREEGQDARYRNLWDLIVNNDDICFTHILPRLNSNDLKFLYGVNTETRKLIKRSSRTWELKKRFNVSEMSSTSTLEVAWEKESLWPWGWTETYFCYRVAFTNKLELLKWAREEKKCKWDALTIRAAARRGNLEMVKYCVANKCPTFRPSFVEDDCARAAKNGHLEILKYLREEAKAPWDSMVLYQAYENEHLECLRYAVEKKCPRWSNYTEKLKELEQSQ